MRKAVLYLKDILAALDSIQNIRQGSNEDRAA
jgi:hypothetical protein